MIKSTILLSSKPLLSALGTWPPSTNVSIESRILYRNSHQILSNHHLTSMSLLNLAYVDISYQY